MFGFFKSFKQGIQTRIVNPPAHPRPAQRNLGTRVPTLRSMRGINRGVGKILTWQDVKVRMFIACTLCLIGFNGTGYDLFTAGYNMAISLTLNWYAALIILWTLITYIVVSATVEELSKKSRLGILALVGGPIVITVILWFTTNSIMLVHFQDFLKGYGVPEGDIANMAFQIYLALNIALTTALTVGFAFLKGVFNKRVRMEQSHY